MKLLPSSIYVVILLASATCSPEDCMAGSPQSASLVMPMAFTECENSGCPATSLGIWTFQGQEGFATWSGNGAVSSLKVERFDQGGVVIRRLNLPNSAAPGLTAVYTGAIDKNNQITGTVTWTWAGFKGGVARGQWRATIGSHQDQQIQLQAQRQRIQQMQTQQRMSAADTLLLMGLVGAMLESGSGDSGTDKPHTRQCIAFNNIDNHDLHTCVAWSDN
jgi:hypothetical protein